LTFKIKATTTDSNSALDKEHLQGQDQHHCLLSTVTTG